MIDYLVEHQDELGGLSFLWLITLAALLEFFWPRRANEQPPLRRWLTNAGLYVFNGLCSRLLIPITGAGLAIFCRQQGWGLFNIIDAPVWLTALMSLLIIDLVGYLQHAVLHKVPLFWRFHKIHHSDLSVDFSTNLRFHPLEMLVSAAVNFAVIMLFGIPDFVLVLDFLLDSFSGFATHSNFALPGRADRIIRLFFITPDMHRVHHSTDQRETDSNYGVVFPWWDRLFGTYVAQPRMGHDGMQLGLSEYQDAKYGTLLWSLWMPFAPLSRASAEQ